MQSKRLHGECARACQLKRKQQGSAACEANLPGGIASSSRRYGIYVQVAHCQGKTGLWTMGIPCQTKHLLRSTRFR